MSAPVTQQKSGSNRLLVTGASGFVGPYLIREALSRYSQASRIIGCTSGAEQVDLQDDRLSWHELDVLNRQQVNHLIRSFAPTHIVHLAAISHVPTALENPVLVWNVNVMGTLNLLEAVRQYAPKAVVLFISSSEIYGRSFQSGIPLDESAKFQPRNPYASSKAAGDLMAGQYAEMGLRVIRARPFNHIGPGQSDDFVVSAFASQIARIEKNLQPPELQVGNLEAVRDFLDVRDVVRAYLDLLDYAPELESGSDFNICSAIKRPIRQIVDELVSLSSVNFNIVTDPSRLRPSDTPLAVGDATKIREQIGWKPERPWSRTLEEILDYWRNLRGLKSGQSSL